ncbi:phosphoribosylanthranilate isomerase [Paenibacillus beijingensis]|uniref:N-(5'-phosphoribosyl)anthranilate isomerase n=1 Tax=Paenibacillus beijingensis TaxID=1126833 RepID=A0A0D5NPT3_9BACL|nr:phosphoribosylanthranilate isomerase [Paenibacillus beijingensis]AJY77160.1 N-(5'-phosphoribosyl)anthranilate isomerase [Paenibacillus beijingensis]
MSGGAKASGGVRVKICGLRDSATIRGMDGLAVDEVGFVFAPSKRRVTPEQAFQLAADVRALRNDKGAAPRTVGVFVNPDPEELARVLLEVPLDVIQLHGGETPEQSREVKRRFGLEVWKAFSAAEGDTERAARAKLAPYAGAVDAVLLDTAGGGTGKTFDWSVIEVYKKAAFEIGAHLYVAGGLHPGNVEELTIRYRPDGVDVSSGVETDGVKDITKIQAFTGKVMRS